MYKVFLIIFLMLTNIFIGVAKNQVNVDSLKVLLSTSQTDSLIFDRSYSISLHYIKTNPDSGIKYMKIGLNSIDKEGYFERYYDGHNLLAGCYWFNNMLDSSINVYSRTLMFLYKANDVEKIAKIQNNLGLTYHYNGNTDSAEKYLFRACQLYDSLDNKKAYAKASLDLGALYTAESRYDKAIEKLLESLAIFEEIDDTLYLIHGYNGVGNLYLNIDESQLALDYYMKALKLTREYDKLDISDELYCNIGLTYFQGLNNNDSAEYYFLKSLSKEGIENNRLLYASNLVNLATLKNDQKNYTEALKYFSIVKDLDLKEADPYSRMVCFINMGYTYLEIGEVDQAKEHIDEGLLQAIALNNLEFQKNAYLYLSRVDSTNGKYVEALAYYQNYVRITLEINNAEVEEKILIINSKHQLNEIQSRNVHLEKQNELKQALIKKHVNLNTLIAVALFLSLLLLLFTYYIYRKTQKLNTSLKIRNHKISQQKEELQTLNNQLNKLISIIAHDLKAPFSALIGLLNELNTNSAHYSEEEKNVIIKGLLQNTMSTYKLLENLMDWSVSKTGLLKMKLEIVNLHALVEEVISLNQLQLRSKALVLNNQLSPNTEVYGDHKMIYTVLVNLISNAIKFSNPSSIIVLSSEVKDNILRMHISDQGIGIPEDHLQTIFSIDSEYQTRGTENEYGTGLGLKVVAEFMSRMNGKVLVNSDLDMGSTFTIELPLNPPNE